MPKLAYTLSATTTRPNDTTAYAAGDVIGQSPAAALVFSAADLAPGAGLLITGAEITTVQSSIPSGLAAKRLHLFRQSPTGIADNAAFDIAAADRQRYLGYIDIQSPVQLGSVHQAQTAQPTAFQVTLHPDERTIYGVLQTVGAYTPGAQTVRTVSLTVIEV